MLLIQQKRGYTTFPCFPLEKLFVLENSRQNGAADVSRDGKENDKLSFIIKASSKVF